MGNSCSSFKLYLEKKVRRASYAIAATHDSQTQVAGSITKRTLARDALATTAPDYFAYDWNLNTQ